VGPRGFSIALAGKTLGTAQQFLGTTAPGYNNEYSGSSELQKYHKAAVDFDDNTTCTMSRIEHERKKTI
jgi:hypothetical protein